MGKESLTFGSTEIEKDKFYHHKTSNFLGDVDVEEVLVSNKISFGKKSISILLVIHIMVIRSNH